MSKSNAKVAQIEASTGKRKRNADLQPVWVAIHQLEGSHRCVGDFSSSMGKHLSHRPKTFDSKILGIFATKEAANKCACDKWDGLGLPEDSDDEEEEQSDFDEDDEDGRSEQNAGEGDDEEKEEKEDFDFEGEGKFYDGADSGYTTVFSQRVFVKKQTLQAE